MPLLTRVTSSVADISTETVVVVADEQQADSFPLPARARVVRDLYPDAGSLGGILTGLSAAQGDWALVVACDMPFLSRALLGLMAEARSGCEAVVPVIDQRPEPTHALYSKACIGPIRTNIEAGILKISAFFESVSVNYLPQPAAQEVDPGLWSFFNVNTEGDLQIAVARAAELSGAGTG